MKSRHAEGGNRKECYESFGDKMAHLGMRVLTLYVVLYSKYSCYSRSWPCLAIIGHSCQVCVVSWGCGQIATGTWLRPRRVFLPPTANNQAILLYHLALSIVTTVVQSSVVRCRLKWRYCLVPFRFYYFPKRF